jgi:eukaryotic-like serine/threonine-protein kinase
VRHWTERPELDQVLDDALELDPADRSAFLERACAGNPTLLAELRSLLAHADSARVLDLSATDFLPAAQEQLTGTLLGPYRVLRELARGGMGTVYLAERADGQFEQRVALKLIKRGMDSEEIQRRFLAERQILARLKHPNIARLVDGGVTAAGQPWFAMEYVDGVPITEYCDTHGLEVTARLRLFEEVCKAVRHAHHSLVVHRDLKPSNILVTAEGEVRLLDFGIAKLLTEDPSHEAAGAVTAHALPMMTPAYAAPEQIRSEPITTATDVYALGGVLYQLLTGKCAQRFERSTPTEIERVVCELDPEPPSAAISRSSPEGARRSRELRGDLDLIVLKALQKQPARRYATADALLTDLQRYQQGLPVLARPDSRLYRARKFVRRHRIGVAASVALVLAMGAGLASTIWQARSVVQEAAKAREVKEFVKGLFRGAMPTESRGREITARELLERGTRRVDSALAGQPVVQLELIHFLGEVNLDLGFYQRGDSLLDRAARLAGRLYGTRSPQVAGELTARAEAAWYGGDYTLADSLLEVAFDIYRSTGSRDERALGEVLSNRASILGEKGEYAKAESLFREVVGITRRVYGPEHLEMALDLSNLGLALWRMNRLDAADSALRASLAIRRRQLDPSHPELLLSMHNLATNLHAQGKYDEAEKLEREVLLGRRRVYPGGHPDVAMALQMLYKIVAARGRYAEAESMAREALAIRRQWLGPNHVLTFEAQANLGTALYLTGNLPEAEQATREALAGYRRSIGEEHPTTLTMLLNLGVILRDQGRYTEATPMLRQSLVLSRKVLGDSSADVAQILRHTGVLLYRQGRLAEAEPLLRQALALHRALLPGGHPATADALTSLGVVLTQRGRAAEAEPLLREALAIRRVKHGADEPRTLDALSALGACVAAQGRYDEAGPMLRDSYKKLRVNPYAWRQLGDAVRRLVGYHRGRGEPELAAAYARELDQEPEVRGPPSRSSRSRERPTR